MNGTSDQIKGRVKEAIGALTDDANLRAEGKLDQKTGKIKAAVENVVDKMKETVTRSRSK